MLRNEFGSLLVRARWSSRSRISTVASGVAATSQKRVSRSPQVRTRAVNLVFARSLLSTRRTTCQRCCFARKAGSGGTAGTRAKEQWRLGWRRAPSLTLRCLGERAKRQVAHSSSGRGWEKGRSTRREGDSVRLADPQGIVVDQFTYRRNQVRAGRTIVVGR